MEGVKQRHDDKSHIWNETSREKTDSSIIDLKVANSDSVNVSF